MLVLPIKPICHVKDIWHNALEDKEDHQLDVTLFAYNEADYWIDNLVAAEWNHFNIEGQKTTN